MEGHVSVVDQLLKYDVRASIMLGTAQVSEGCQSNVFLRMISNMDKIFQYGAAALMHASWQGHASVVEALLQFYGSHGLELVDTRDSVSKISNFFMLITGARLSMTSCNSDGSNGADACIGARKIVGYPGLEEIQGTNGLARPGILWKTTR